MTTILLIRHGESCTNRLKQFAGQMDIPLNDLGILQAKETARFVTSNYKVDKIYSSDLSRAYNTALPIAEILGMEITTYKELRELFVGKWQGMTFDEVEKVYPGQRSMWLNDIDFVPDGGETKRGLATRGMNIVTKIARENDGKTIAVGTHGGLIRAVQALIIFGAAEKFYDAPVTPNASVTELIYDNGAFEIKHLNQNEHLKEINENYEKTLSKI